MKTVGEFLSAGLNFVEGDCVSDYLGGEEKFLDECDKNDCNEHLGFSLSFVTEFTWRENTGVKPEFNGDKEIELRNGVKKLTSSLGADDGEDWSMSGRQEDIIKWRPSLNQPHKLPDNAYKQVEVIVNNNTPSSIELAEKGGFSYELKAASSDKPIFTQAMAVNGELPPVGAKCIYVFMENGSEYTGSIAAIDGNVIWFKLDGGGYKTCFGKHKFKAVDNRTDREKAIDEVYMKLYEGKFAQFNEEVTLALIGDIYDAGLLKC